MFSVRYPSQSSAVLLPLCYWRVDDNNFCRYYQPAYSIRRHLLRHTWLKSTLLERELNLKTRVLFFVGRPVNISTQMLIQYENELYQDIVQSSFVDTYKHNTYKVMSYLRWVGKPGDLLSQAASGIHKGCTSYTYTTGKTCIQHKTLNHHCIFILNISHIWVGTYWEQKIDLSGILNRLPQPTASCRYLSHTVCALVGYRCIAHMQVCSWKWTMTRWFSQSDWDFLNKICIDG